MDKNQFHAIHHTRHFFQKNDAILRRFPIVGRPLTSQDNKASPDPQIHEGTAAVQEGNLQVTESLHRALLNLRRVDSARIVRVDAICINQDDVEERNQQVAMMPLVYSKASQIVIWLVDIDKVMIDLFEEINKFDVLQR
jgi:hypothetical protein